MRRENSGGSKVQAGGRTARVPAKGRGGNYSRGRAESEARTIRERGKAAARVSGSGSHRAGYTPGPHGGAAETEAVSGYGAYRDFLDRRLFSNDWRPDRTIGNAAAAFERSEERRVG